MTRWAYLALALVLVTLVAAVIAHANAAAIPGDKIPIHWDINGQADGWVAKDDTFMAFYLFPLAIGAVVVLGLFAFPWLSPRNFAVESFRRTYDYVFFLVAALFVYIDGVILWSQFRAGVMLDRALIAGICFFFALIGNVLGKVKRNFWVGVRTPWTLADTRVWDQTHRVAAWLFVFGGVVGGIGALVGVPFVACFVLLMVCALAPVLYSLVLYKRLEREGKLEEQQHPVAAE